MLYNVVVFEMLDLGRGSRT